MNRRFLQILLTFFCICSIDGYAQINCTVPLPPVLTSVSVDPGTGKTGFTWILSESSDVAGYIIYSFTGSDGQAIDTVWDPAATGHVITNTAPKYSSVSYVIAAHRLSAVPGMPGCTSPLSNVLSTIFCDAKIDTCNKKIMIAWNSYKGEPKSVLGYSVMISADGAPFEEISSVASDVNSFVPDDFITGKEYCFYIKANLEDGSSSTSNRACLRTDMQRPPDWINADYATVNRDNKIELLFSVDPYSEINEFVLERKTGDSGSFSQVAKIVQSGGSVRYTDNTADINAINYYRLSAINSCDIPITVSNTASNIVLSLEKNNDLLILTWNKYRQWNGIISDYRLFIDTGSGFYERALVTPGDSAYTLDYHDIMYEVEGNAVCFYINAEESFNPYGITGQSRSSSVCTEPVEIITVPNIFTPNNDHVNDYFKPVLSFIPAGYHLIISDSHGSVLFETRDFNETWNGMGKGVPHPDGIYFWLLRITTSRGKKISKTGIVTLLKNP